MLLPTADQVLLREACRDLLADHTTSESIRALVDSETGHDTGLWKQTADLGWTAVAVPDRFDGLDGGAADLAVIVEEFGRALQPSPIAATSAVAWLLVRHGTDALAERLLPAVASGGAVLSWALEEPGGTGLITARHDGDALVLTGKRGYLPDAVAAGHVVVDVDYADGRGLVVLPTDSAGLIRRDQRTIDLTRRYQQIQLDGVRIDSSWALPAGPAAADLFRIGVVLQCAESVGIASRLLDMTLTYVGQRSQFGRLIGSFQALKHRIADLHIAVEGASVATRDAAEALDASRSDVDQAVHVAKSWTGPGASLVASEALQLHGGVGFTWEHDLHLFLRRAKANELLLGTPSWHDEQLTTLLERSVD
jgi:alkylation response protein AidB-like acyl-CoA dehydrogenase